MREQEAQADALAVAADEEADRIAEFEERITEGGADSLNSTERAALERARTALAARQREMAEAEAEGRKYQEE